MLLCEGDLQQPFCDHEEIKHKPALGKAEWTYGSMEHMERIWVLWWDHWGPNAPTSALLVTQDNKLSYHLNRFPLGLQMLAAWASLRDRTMGFYPHCTPLFSYPEQTPTSKHPSLPASWIPSPNTHLEQAPLTPFGKQHPFPSKHFIPVSNELVCVILWFTHSFSTRIEAL